MITNIVRRLLVNAPLSSPVALVDSKRAFVALSFDYRASGLWPDLPRLRAALERLVTAWSLSLRHELGNLMLSDEPVGAVMDAIENLLFTQMAPDEAIVIYVGGHGARLGADHFVAGPAAAPDRLTTRNGLAASDLAQVIGQGRAKQVALLIDTCYSGAAGARAAASVDEIISRVAKDGFSMFVMSSAHAEDLAWDGVFVEGLLDVLADPDPLLWSKTERFVAPSHVARALRARLGAAIESREYNYVEPLLPNLSYREPSTLAKDAAVLAHEHFLRAASGLGGDDARWHFAGRRPVLARISSWLSESPQGMFVLTGPPGAGKSAVLGLIALFSDETGRRAVAERANGSEQDGDKPYGWVPRVDAAIHARDKALADIVLELGQALGHERLRGTDDLLAGLAAADHQVTVLVDALDEAWPDELPRITAFLRDLADLPRVRVVVGTRPDRARAEYGPRFGPLLRGLEPATMLDLAEDEDQSRTDVAEYVRERLREAARDGEGHDPGFLEEVADEIANRTRGVFLYARLMTEIVLRGARLEPARDWRGQLPGPDAGDFLTTVVGQDLERIPERRRAVVRRMLMALSFAEGEGFPRYGIWAAAATALTGIEHGDEDAATTLAAVPWYLAESREAGEQVYRLNHETLIKHFRTAALHEF